MRVKTTALTIVLASAVCFGACGQNASSPSPTGPSPASPATPSPGISGSATISGTVAAASGGASSGWAPASTGGLTITVSGTNVTATVDGSGHFVLNNVPPGSVTLHFTGSGVDATLTITDVATNDQIQLTVEVSGSSASIADEEHDGHDSRSELEGTISAIDTAAGTLTVRQTLVTVPAGTPIRHGSTTLTFAQLSVGERVHIKGTRQGSGVVASEVNVQNMQAVPPPQGTEVHGTVSALAGTCPSLTFTVGSTTVVTSASTQFKGEACSALANGASVEVKGTAQGTTLTATEVDADTENQEADVKGTLGAIAGTCPVLTFTVGSTTVVTTAATEFKGTACSSLASGTSVEVKGTRDTAGIVTATRVQTSGKGHD